MKKREELRARLHIDNPCHEDWAQMSETERGKFCGTCATEVLDFERMTEAEIIAFWENYTPQQHVCMRIASKPAPAAPSRWRAAAATVLVAASLWSCKSTEATNNTTENPDKTSNTVRKEANWQSALKGDGIRGYAVKNGNKLAYASVSLICGNELLAKMQTKQGGEFILKFPDYDPEKHKDLHIHLSHMQYEGVEYPLTVDKNFEAGTQIELGKPTHRVGKIRVE